LTASGLEMTIRHFVPSMRLYIGPYSRAHFSNWRWALREGIYRVSEDWLVEHAERNQPDEYSQ
jgi:hypothetical protein